MKFSSVACLLGSIQAANISNWTPMQELAQVETLAEAQVLPGFEVTPTTTSNDIMYVLNVLGKSQDNIASWQESDVGRENLVNYLTLMETDIDNVDANIAANLITIQDAILAA